MLACVQVVSNAGAYTQACDVWSIGVITYMLLSGTPPFKGDTDSAVLQAVRLSKYGTHRCRSRVYWLTVLLQLYLVSPVCSPRYRTPPPHYDVTCVGVHSFAGVVTVLCVGVVLPSHTLSMGVLLQVLA